MLLDFLLCAAEEWMELESGVVALGRLMEGDFDVDVTRATEYLAGELAAGAITPQVVNGLAYQLLDSANPVGEAAARRLWETLSEGPSPFPEALANLAIACLNSAGGNCDPAYANRLFERILSIPGAPAQVRLTALSGLGDSLMLGRGAQVDRHRALALHEEAAGQGISSAAMNAAVTWDDYPGQSRENLPPVDYDKAAHFYGLAAAGGIVHATARLALLHLHGRHSAADANQGFSLLRKAAKRGDAAARAALQEIAERMMSSAFP